MPNSAKAYVLTLTCPDRVGIVAGVARHMEAENCFIQRSRSFGDAATGQFFAQIAFHPVSEPFDLEGFRLRTGELADSLDAHITVHDARAKLRTLIMVSKFDHCAHALLDGARKGAIPIEPVAIVSNHDDLRGPLAHWDLPFHHVPVSKETKPAAEAALFELVTETRADLIVLARYMQILSPRACKRLAGRCINIHHSFLPSFKGARPYHQAHERGVKMIGATAHYVTPDLDEGPIITQVAEPVDHNLSASDFVAMGRDLEARALARAVKAHAEHRVLMNGIKTVVFS